MSPLFGRLAGRAAQAWPWAAAAASGALLALCYPPFSFGGLAWVALAPLLAALWFSQEAARREWLRVLGLGWVFGLVFFVTSLAWLRTVTLPGWILLSFYLAIY
ncbi:MAG: hypothetical protein N2322_08200, partial [Terrimicrobiaceae bacterium]|nr:hypothetical protein [Terrimicrobiaceae bacterium]